ncbi:MAG: twin-arginine translocation signal domain-containing protein [Fuerstiella sp.]
MTSRDEQNARVDRRDVLKSATMAAAAVGIGGIGHSRGNESRPVRTPTGKTSRVVAENQKPGTTDWQLTRVRVNAGNYRTSLVEGYCSHQSIAAGETLSVFVSTAPERKFVLDVYRMGYYGGQGGCHKASFGPLPGRAQPVPELGPLPGRLRECQWEPSLEFTIPEDWLSGVYLGKLTTVPESVHEPYWQSYVIFIVRDERPADILFQCSDNTWQAYNRWPENESLYTHPDGAHAPGVAVSFDRPYGKYVQIYDHPLSIGSGEFLLWEFPLSYWLEQHGYDVTYGSNLDTCSADFITRCRAFLSVGHDEYWDRRQFSAVEQALNKGTSLLWLCGNSVFVDSPFAKSSTGRDGRIISRVGCYGDLRSDELESYSSLFAGLRATAPDERRIMGVRSVVPFNGGGDWTCVNSGHWLFEGTGMRDGDSIPGLVGWEHHGEPDPERAGLEVVAAGPIWSGGTREGRYESVVFPGPRNNVVFNASTIFWAQGLAAPPGHIIPWSHFSRPHGPDARVQQMTQNVLAAALKQD